MSSTRRINAIAEAFAVALQDAFTSWRRQEAPQESADVAYPLYVRAVELHARYEPGKHGWCTVTVRDRRPGRDFQEVYRLEPNTGKARLSRARNEA